MVCYVIPTSAAAMILAHRFFGKKKDIPGHQLSLLLGGGAIFGIVDHWWNGQLTLIGPNIAHDILLGLVITVVIYAVWFGMLALSPTIQAQESVSPAPEKK
jgi:drug/metabolite transporter (DMT)-like permease